MIQAIGWFTDSVNMIWIILIVVTVAIELMTVDLTSIWFAIGALVALLLSLLGVNNPVIQIIVFLVVSITLLVTIGKWSRKLMGKNKVATNIDAAIGKEIFIIKGANQFEYGEGKYQGLTWTVACKDKKSISAGQIGIIIEVEGNKLIVEPKE